MSQGNADQAGPADGRAIRGSNQAGMRAHNERLVLSLIRRHGATAKADIARATGLSAQTVSVIMRALESDGLLLRGEPVRGRVGQPSVPMALAPDGAFFFGLKVGRRSLELVLTNFLGQVVARRQRTHGHPMPDDTMAFAREAIDALLAEAPPRTRARVAGLGIAMPYLLWDWARALGVPQAEMDRWRDTDLRADLAARYDFPVYLQNDATAACGAELVFGQAGTPPDFLHFYIGYFIGGGVVLGGGLYPGATGNAGALGSLPVPGPGPDGESRQLLDVASLAELESMLRAAGHDTTPMWRDPAQLALDRQVMDRWVAQAAAGIAHAIAAAVAVIDFRAVLIDGWIPTELRARLVAAVTGRLSRIDTAGLTLPEIREGTIGADARVLGAASLPLSERFLVEPNAFQKGG